MNFRLLGDSLPGQLGILMIPAFPLAGAQWQQVAQSLGDIPCLWVEHPHEGEPSISRYAEVAARACELVGLTGVIAAGNSIGGYVAQHLALNYPNLVHGLALFGTNGRTDDASTRSRRLQVALDAMQGKGVEAARRSARGLVAEESVSDLAYNLTDQLTAQTLAWCQRAMASRQSTLEDLSKLSLPAIVMQGRSDLASSVQDALDLGQALGVEPMIVDAGHLLPLEQPALCARELRRLYNRCS